MRYTLRILIPTGNGVEQWIEMEEECESDAQAKADAAGWLDEVRDGLRTSITRHEVVQ